MACGASTHAAGARAAAPRQTAEEVKSICCHTSHVRRAAVGRPAGRLVATAASLILVAAGCVSIAPIPSSSPTPTGALPTVSRQPTSSLEPGATSLPTPTPLSTTIGPTPVSTGPATPGPTIDPALAAQIDSVIAEVPAIRQLERLADVPYEFITREQFRDDLIELQFEEVPEERLRAEERLLKRLGLLPDDADLLQLLVDLYGAQVAAFYRPDTKRFYIIQRDQPFGPSDKIIVAHEYTHALQDQHFDLEGTRIKDLSRGDAALGQLGAIEGDATLTMQLWSIANLTAEETLQVLIEAMGQLDDPALANMPPVLRRQLEYPYAEGFSFIQEVHGLGDFDAVNAALTDPPESTEQVLHPDKYMADEAPVEVTLPDHSSTLSEGGDSWSLPYQQTVGELILQVWAAGDESPPDTIPGLPVEWPHAETVAGWGGDRLNMYEGPTGAWIINWLTVWDTQADADEFASRVEELRDRLDGPVQIHAGGLSPEVCLIIGSDALTGNMLPGTACQGL